MKYQVQYQKHYYLKEGIIRKYNNTTDYTNHFDNLLEVRSFISKLNKDVDVLNIQLFERIEIEGNI